MADPEFRVGRRPPRRGLPTPEVVTFRKICMSTRKNLDLKGGSTLDLHICQNCNDKKFEFSCLNLSVTYELSREGWHSVPADMKSIVKPSEILYCQNSSYVNVTDNVIAKTVVRLM